MSRVKDVVKKAVGHEIAGATEAMAALQRIQMYHKSLFAKDLARMGFQSDDVDITTPPHKIVLHLDQLRGCVASLNAIRSTKDMLTTGMKTIEVVGTLAGLPTRNLASKCEADEQWVLLREETILNSELPTLSPFVRLMHCTAMIGIGWSGDKQNDDAPSPSVNQTIPPPPVQRMNAFSAIETKIKQVEKELQEAQEKGDVAKAARLKQGLTMAKHAYAIAKQRASADNPGVAYHPPQPPQQEQKPEKPARVDD